MTIIDRQFIVDWLCRVVSPKGEAKSFDLWIRAGRDRVAWNFSTRTAFYGAIKCAVHGVPEFQWIEKQGGKELLLRCQSLDEPVQTGEGQVYTKGRTSRLLSLDIRDLSLDKKTGVYTGVLSTDNILIISGKTVDRLSPPTGAAPRRYAAGLPPLACVRLTIDRGHPLPSPYRVACYSVEAAMECLAVHLDLLGVGDSVLVPKEFGPLRLPPVIAKLAAKWRGEGIRCGYRCRAVADGGMRVWRYR